MERLTARNEKGEAHATQVGYYDIVDRLADYEDAEEQGLLLRLPFEIGQKVYYIYESRIDKNLMIGSMVYSYSCLDFPKNYFETREEAEQALKRMEGEQHELPTMEEELQKETRLQSTVGNR